MQRKKNKKKIYLERNKQRIQKVNNQKLCNSYRTEKVDKYYDKIVYRKIKVCDEKCKNNIIKCPKHFNGNEYKHRFKTFLHCKSCNFYYCNNSCKRKYNDLKILINEEIAFLKTYEKWNNEQLCYEYGIEKINPIKNMKDYYKIANDYSLSFNLKPSNNWFFKVLLCICLIFKNKLNMNYSSYHTDLVFSFIYC